MSLCFFCTDLHGYTDRYEKLLNRIREQSPDLVLLGGDLLPHGFAIKEGLDDFYQDFLLPSFLRLRDEMGSNYPSICIILGNDDARINEKDFLQAEQTGVWHYIHQKKFTFGEYTLLGYAYVPPTPFRLKDWERYDVSRYVDPGCIHPLEGMFSVPPPERDIEYQTIEKDLQTLTTEIDPDKMIVLFHSPPHKTHLDRAALDGMKIDHIPLDVHVGSIAIKRFIEETQPLMTLHGHIHESSRITGHWYEYIGNTLAVNGSWDGTELSLISFDPDQPGKIRRELI